MTASGNRHTLEQSPLSPVREGETLFMLSIDTEEDNWVPARDGVSVDNAEELPRFQTFLDRLAIRPTYFVTHSLAVDPTASQIVRDLNALDRVEIGAHLHPWNTPPLDEDFVLRNTMMLNLPVDLQRAKLARLTDRLEECLGARPHAFRAGRWGFGRETIGVALECGYAVDSSVTPFTSWAAHGDGASHIGAPINVYRVDTDTGVVTPKVGGPLLEVPLSFGFNQAPLAFWNRLYDVIKTPISRALLADRFAAWTNLLRWVTLSPETDTVENMLDLTRALLASGARHLHMYLHSPTLKPGLTPFVRTMRERDRVYASIEEYLERLAKFVRLRFVTVSEAATLLDPLAKSHAVGV